MSSGRLVENEVRNTAVSTLWIAPMDYRKCFTDAMLLVDESATELPFIEELYLKSLVEKEIDRRLPIRIKTVLEHLRSALDFVAKGLSLRYAPQNKKKVYFPYAKLNIDQETFLRKKYIDNSIPGLSNLRPDIARVIIAMQHFSHPGAKWFPEFMELNNQNKHIHLVPHGLFQGVSLEFEGRKIIAEGISLGETGTIETDFATLKGPLTITPVNASDFERYGIFGAERWEEIFIEGYGFPLNTNQFIAHCVKALSSVVKQFNQMVP